MCRLLGVMSIEPVSANVHISSSKYNVIRQVEDEGHHDGWGFGFYGAGNLKLLTRSTSSASDDAKIIGKMSSEAKSEISFFFVRNASNPLGLDRGKLLTLEAIQPFSSANTIFMHNGAVNNPTNVLENLREYGMKARSMNDSEAYFIAFMHFLDKGLDVREALMHSEQLIIRTFKKICKNSEPFTSLNAVVSDGKKLYAYNRYESDYKGTISDSARDYYKMCYRNDGKKIIISSEPTDEGVWHDIGNGKFLEANVKNGYIVSILSDVTRAV